MKNATISKKPKVRERAGRPESPVIQERAVTGEESNSFERAMPADKPRNTERAGLREETIQPERLSDPIKSGLSAGVRAYYDYQRERMMLDGRLEQKKDGTAKKGGRELSGEVIELLRDRRAVCFLEEEKLGLAIAKIIKTHPLWKHFLKDVKGCGESMAAVIITEFDINKAPTVSNLWSFAGLAPGKDRKVKGQKCPFNQFLRSKLCGVLGSSFLKCNSPYRKYYDDMKHRLESAGWGMDSKNPTDKKRPKAGHQHKAANRYMVKMFLRDLYVAWRTLEGLEVRKPYQEEYLGKKHEE